jgi:hypothetical protein
MGVVGIGRATHTIELTRIDYPVRCVTDRTPHPAAAPMGSLTATAATNDHVPMVNSPAPEGALLRQLDAACTAVDELAEAAIAHFEQHPDAAIITSFPGLGMLAGARVLAR